MNNLDPKEVAGLERALELLIEKTNRLRKALILETDAGVQVQIRRTDSGKRAEN